MHEVYLSLGSNLNDRLGLLREAVRLIGQTEGCLLTAQSGLYETEPVGYTDQGLFLNMAVRVETCLLPEELLQKLQQIEEKLGRTREIRWGPRTLDIDILLYDRLQQNSPRLTLPHPRMLERAFVLVPLKEIFREETLFGRSLEQWIEGCGDRPAVKLFSAHLGQ